MPQPSGPAAGHEDAQAVQLDWFTHGNMLASAFNLKSAAPMFYTVFGIHPALWYALAMIGPVGGIGPEQQIKPTLPYVAECAAKAACQRHFETGRWEEV